MIPGQGCGKIGRFEPCARGPRQTGKSPCLRVTVMPAPVATAARCLAALLRGLAAAVLAYAVGMIGAGALADALGYGVMRPAVLAVVFALTPAAFVLGAGRLSLRA